MDYQAAQSSSSFRVGSVVRLHTRRVASGYCPNQSRRDQQRCAVRALRRPLECHSYLSAITQEHCQHEVETSDSNENVQEDPKSTRKPPPSGMCVCAERDVADPGATGSATIKSNRNIDILSLLFALQMISCGVPGVIERS